MSETPNYYAILTANVRYSKLINAYDEIIDIKCLFDYFHDFEKGAYENILDYYEFCIMNDNQNMFIFTADIQSDLYLTKKNIKDLMINPLIQGNKNA